MKINNTLGLRKSETKSTCIGDLGIGQVFTCEETWPDHVFMMIWCGRGNHCVAFTALVGPEDRDPGQTWGFKKKSEQGEKIAVLYDAKLLLGEPS